MKKFLAVGTECLEFRADADKAKSKQPDVFFPFNHPNCCLKIVSWSDTLLNHEASLGNALFWVKG
jgi:hypothetical protein